NSRASRHGLATVPRARTPLSSESRLQQLHSARLPHRSGGGPHGRDAGFGRRVTADPDERPSKSRKIIARSIFAGAVVRCGARTSPLGAVFRGRGAPSRV